MKVTRWLALLAVPVLLASLPACGNNSGKTKLAFISNNAYEFWKFAERGTKDAAAELGNVEVEFKMPSKGAVEEQRRFIEDLQAVGVRAIAVSPNNVDSQIDFYRGVNRSIPMLMVDSDVDEGKDPSALEARRFYLGTDNVAAGEAVAQLIKEAVPNGGKFVIFVGKLDVLNAVQRSQGVIIGLCGGKDKATEQLRQFEAREYPIRCGDYELLEVKTDGGQQPNCRAKVDDTLTKEPDLRCMVGLWEYNPPAILEGLKSFKDGAELGKIAVVAFDENAATLQGIKDGHVHGTVVQNPYKFGYDAVKIMAALVRGDEEWVRKEYKPDENGRIWVPHRVIKKDNVEEFEKELRKLRGG